MRMECAGRFNSAETSDFECCATYLDTQAATELKKKERKSETV